VIASGSANHQQYWLPAFQLRGYSFCAAVILYERSFKTFFTVI